MIDSAVILRAPGRITGELLFGASCRVMCDTSQMCDAHACRAEEDLLVARLQRGGVRAAAVDAVEQVAPLLQVRSSKLHSLPGGFGVGSAGEQCQTLRGVRCCSPTSRSCFALMQEWGAQPEQVAAFVCPSSSQGSSSELGTAVSTVLPWPEGASSTAAMQALVHENLLRAAACNSQQQHGAGQQQGQWAQEQREQREDGDDDAGGAGIVVVGYAMRLSREQQLAAQRLLQLLPAPARGAGGCRVCFVPLDLARPLSEQGRIDVVLHKASDELVSGPGGAGGGGGSSGGAPRWSEAMLALQRQLAEAPGVAVVDPFESAAKVGGAAQGLCRTAMAPPYNTHTKFTQVDAHTC